MHVKMAYGTDLLGETADVPRASESAASWASPRWTAAGRRGFAYE
jgi:hypothetical protein